jgi:glycosyltransferase involved in cell wall biosynthesis
MTPDVSVVIPTRNRSELLRAAALPSALGQEDVRVEVIVVDDGSTDATATAVRAVGDPRLRVLRHDAPRGVGAARNTGIDAASAPWLAFLDDDDLWSPQKLRRQLETLTAGDADLTYTGVVIVDEHRRPTALAQAAPAATLSADLRRRNVLTGGSSCVVVSTELVRRVGGFDETLPLLADWDLWLRLVPAARPAPCDELLVAYVRHSRRMPLPPRATIAEIHRMRARYGPGVFTPDEESFLTWVAAEHRRAGRRGDAATAYVRAAVTGRAPAHLVRAALTVAGRRRTPPAAASPVRAPEWLEAA